MLLSLGAAEVSAHCLHWMSVSQERHVLGCELESGGVSVSLSVAARSGPVPGRATGVPSGRGQRVAQGH